MTVLPLLVAACLSGSGRSDSTLFPRRRTLHRRSLIQQDMSMPNLPEQQPMSMPLEQLSMSWEHESMPLQQFEMITENDFVCMTADQCKEKFISLKQEDGTRWKGRFYANEQYPTKGCFAKGDNGNLYFGIGGSREQMATRDFELPGVRERIWCDQKEMRDIILVTPSPVPGSGSLFGEIADVVITSQPTLKPTMSPLQSIAMWNGTPLIFSPDDDDTINDPSNQPTPKPITPQPIITDSPVSNSDDPSNQPTPKPITPQPIITDSPVSNSDVLEENSDFQWQLENDETGGFDMFDVDWDVVPQNVAGATGSKSRKTSSPTTDTLSGKSFKSRTTTTSSPTTDSLITDSPTDVFSGTKSSKSVKSTKTSSPTTDSLVTTGSPTDVFSSTKSSKRNGNTALVDTIMEVNNDKEWDLNIEEVAGAFDNDDGEEIAGASDGTASKSSKTHAPTRDGDQVVCALGKKCKTISPTTDTLSSKSSKSVKSTKTSSPTTDSLVKSKTGKMSKTSAPTYTPTMRGDPIVAQGNGDGKGAPDDNSDLAWNLEGEVAASSGGTASKSSKTNAPTKDGDQVVCALGSKGCKTSSPTKSSNSKSSKSVVVTPDDINSILSSNEVEQTDNSYMWATVGICVAGVVLLLAAAFTKKRRRDV